jgi:hypothetical protein
MPKVVSQRQISANRRNAKASTGPKSMRGKRRSARNALKHGLLAREAVLSDRYAFERRADFDALLADLLAELKPRTVLEQTLVERIAVAYWRLRRAQRYEAGAIQAVLDAPSNETIALHSIRCQLQEAQSNLATARHRLALLDLPPGQDPKTDRERLRFVTRRAYGHQLDASNPTDPDFLAKIRESVENDADHYESEIESLTAQLPAAEQQAAASIRQQARLRSIPDEASILRLIRYENMLDRELHRALIQWFRLRGYEPALAKRAKKTVLTEQTHCKATPKPK